MKIPMSVAGQNSSCKTGPSPAHHKLKEKKLFSWVAENDLGELLTSPTIRLQFNRR
jgi:hypothetical protein